MGFEADDSELTDNTFTGSTTFAMVELWGDNNTLSGGSLISTTLGSGEGILINSEVNQATLEDVSIQGFASALSADGLVTLNLINVSSSGNTSGGSITNTTTVNLTTNDSANTVDINGALVEANRALRCTPLGLDRASSA